MLASIASLGPLSNSDFIGFMSQLAPQLGENGKEFSEQIADLEQTLGQAGAETTIAEVLKPESQLGAVVAALDPEAGKGLTDASRQFADMRAQLNQLIERQLVDANVDQIMPAVDAALLRLAPIQESDDFFASYIEALWSVLRDPSYYPLMDEGIANLVHAAVQEGVIQPTQSARSRGRQTGAAREFLARLPTFPLAGMDEIIGIRDELRSPVTRFRSEMVSLSRELTVDAFHPQFVEEAQDAWVERVQPALEELQELVEEKRLLKQFSRQVPAAGVAASVGGLVTGVLAHEPLVAAVTASASVVATGIGAVHHRRDIESQIRRRPYFLLHRAEELLSGRASA